MKNLFKSLFVLLIMPAIVFGDGNDNNTARLQVIHNAADPAASVVDIYVNGGMYEDDFSFREATDFRTVPAGVELNIGVAPGNSQSSEESITVIPVTLAAGKTYVAIANGVIGEGFEPNPEGSGIGFNLFALDKGREQSPNKNRVYVAAFHGATDAPTVDVLKKSSYGSSVLFDNLSYGEFSRYRYLRPERQTLQITPGGDNANVLVSYDVDLTGLGGGAAVVFASGFLTPDNDNFGPAFGLFAALPNGAVVEFPVLTETAMLQVIHNAADPAASMVDIYVNGSMYEDDFAFREATEFRTVPAGVTLNIGVAPGNSASADESLATIPVVLEAGKTYVAVANGVIGSGFENNPDGRSIGFSLFARDGIKTSSMYHNTVQVLAFHGATDAPTVDVVLRNGWYRTTAFDNLTYGEFSDYGFLGAREYIVDITPGDNNTLAVASYTVNLSGLGGGAAVVFASGFLTPDNDNFGPAFGLFAALPDGTVVEFPPYIQTARLQVIHNAADPAAEMVDIYVNGGLYEDDFAFREATEFRTVPAGVTLNIGIAPASSSSADDAIAVIPVTLEPNKTYVAMANGVLGSEFSENPDGRDISFQLFARDGVREEAFFNAFVKLLAFHGATDAPMVDIRVRGKYYSWTLFNDLGYGDFSKYRTVLPTSYTLDITPANDNNTVVASFLADLNGLGGGAAVVFASGFLTDPSQGPGFGLLAALPNGTVVELPLLTDGDDNQDTFAAEKTESDLNLPTEFGLNQNYPNPFNPTTTISFALPSASTVTLKVYNLLGQTVQTLVNETMEAGVHQVNFDASAMASGMYFYSLQAGEYSETKKMMLLK